MEFRHIMVLKVSVGNSIFFHKNEVSTPNLSSMIPFNHIFKNRTNFENMKNTPQKTLFFLIYINKIEAKKKPNEDESSLGFTNIYSKKNYFVTTLIFGKFPPFPPDPASILMVLTPLLIKTFFTAKALLLFNLTSPASEKAVILICKFLELFIN
jgi:hypothetical protein